MGDGSRAPHLPAPSSSAHALGSELGARHPSRDRTHWNRIFSVALFVEHVLLGTQGQVPELSELVSEYVLLLNKVSTRAPAAGLSGRGRLPLDAGSSI